MPNVEIIRPAYVYLRRLMNYQYYRIPIPPNYSTLWNASNYLTSLKSVKIQFAATEPILLFELLDQLYLSC